MAEKYIYEKWNEEKNEIETVYEFTNDTDGSITGRFVINVFAWFDENPEERKRLGWIKHIVYDNPSDVGVDYNPQTQILYTLPRQVDEYTVVDEYRVVDKSEEQMLFEEMLEEANSSNWRFGGITFI